MDERPSAKSEFIRARASTEQFRRIHAHCRRLNVSMGSRVLELLRRDIIAHSHFDLSYELGSTRKPRRTHD